MAVTFNEAENKVWNSLNDEVREKITVPDQQRKIISNIFQQACELINLRRGGKDKYTAKLVDNPRVDTELGDALQMVGSRFMINSEVNIPIPKEASPIAQRLIATLIGTWKSSEEDERSKIPFCLLFKGNPTVAKELREWMQQQFLSAETTIPNKTMRLIFLRHLISYLPYLSPKEGSLWQVPFGAKGELITYKLERIELTPRVLSSPMTAYGLVPDKKQTDCADNGIILLLKGTTFPADDGFYLSLISDLNPFFSVGGMVYHLFAEKRIEKWFKEKRKDLKDAKATVIGISLGGTLALQTACYLTQHISSVHAFVSPGITSCDVRAWERRKQKLAKKNPPLPSPQVNVYLQSGDWICSWVGSRWAPDWRINRLVVLDPPKSSIEAHSSLFAARTGTSLEAVDPQIDSKRMGRRLWSVVQNCLTIPFFVLGVALLPLFCIIHNIKRLAMRLKPEEERDCVVSDGPDGTSVELDLRLAEIQGALNLRHAEIGQES